MSQDSEREKMAGGSIPEEMKCQTGSSNGGDWVGTTETRFISRGILLECLSSSFVEGTVSFHKGFLWKQ